MSKSVELLFLSQEDVIAEAKRRIQQLAPGG